MDDRKRETKRGMVWLGALGLLFAAMAYFYYSYPQRNIGPRQPIFFSHRVHAGVKEIPCQFCHPGVEHSPHAGIPPMEKCFFCHQYITPRHPQIEEEKELFDRGEPVPWVRIYWVPDFVFFNHLPHVRWAKLDCTECHGEVQTLDRLLPVNFEMGFCIECHRKKGAQVDCWLACHR